MGGRVPRLLDTKIKKTDADGYFSFFTIGINLDYFILIAGCFGTYVEQHVCSEGKWLPNRFIDDNKDIIIFNPALGTSPPYAFEYDKIDCGPVVEEDTKAVGRSGRAK